MEVNLRFEIISALITGTVAVITFIVLSVILGIIYIPLKFYMGIIQSFTLGGIVRMIITFIDMGLVKLAGGRNEI